MPPKPQVSPLASGRTYRGIGPAARDADRRARLLAAGLDAFGTRGYPASSIEALCSAAGVSTRNFYDHFANREALLIAVYDEIVSAAQAELASALGAVVAGSPIAVWARAGVEAFTGFMLEDPRRARVNFIEVVGASQAVERHRRAVLGQFAALLRATVEALIASGQLSARSGAVKHVQVAVLIGGVQESITDWVSTAEDERMPLDDVVDALVEIVVLVAN
ncbi:MAG: TetR/AcrR family transcriptional regulator [Actinomycetota bacterium]|nr:TetR/AcrR family transcriptional regulator [Actinomycetota bacterium]